MWLPVYIKLMKCFLWQWLLLLWYCTVDISYPKYWFNSSTPHPLLFIRIGPSLLSFLFHCYRKVDSVISCSRNGCGFVIGVCHTYWMPSLNIFMASFPYFKCHTAFQRFKDLYIATRRILNLQEKAHHHLPLNKQHHHMKFMVECLR